MDLFQLSGGLFSTRALRQWLDPSVSCGCMPTLGPKVLRVTLVTAGCVASRSGFYIEVWTEPSVGHPKNSRIHRPSGGGADLGSEQLELDWFGDEKELVLHFVEYTGSKQSKDLPTFELRVPRAAVERYAQEAEEGQGNTQCGTRSFRMAPLAKQDALQRKRRFQDMLLPSGLAAFIFQRLGEENGLHIPSVGELQKLREENRALRQENAVLMTQAGMSSRSAAHSQEDGRAPAPRLALRFELVSRHGAGRGAALGFRQASFQELELA